MSGLILYQLDQKLHNLPHDDHESLEVSLGVEVLLESACHIGIQRPLLQILGFQQASLAVFCQLWEGVDRISQLAVKEEHLHPQFLIEVFEAFISTRAGKDIADAVNPMFVRLCDLDDEREDGENKSRALNPRHFIRAT